MADETKYPQIQVNLGDLDGPEGNAFAILGAVSKALKKHGLSQELVEEYYEESQAGDYENLLAVAKRWVDASWT